MPTLSCFFAIYTDGSSPADAFQPPAGANVFLGEMSELIVPSPHHDELFGPHLTQFDRFIPARGFLLGLTAEFKGDPNPFFAEARRVLLEATRGLNGMGLDVLRMWPFPLGGAAEAVPEELLPEDLFAVGFNDLGEHGYRAETFGLAKLGQRELSFEFKGAERLEEAALLCGHLADWLMEHQQVVAPAQSLAFGFDRVTFLAAEGAAGGPFRGWHPPLVQRLLPASLFPGVGVLEVRSTIEGHAGEHHDLTLPLQRALDQRLLLEELGLTGDSPHHSLIADVRGRVHRLSGLTAYREQPRTSRDSGWRFVAAGEAEQGSGVMTLGDLARRIPGLVCFLALPPGVRLEWSAEGTLSLDATRARHLDDEEDTEDLD